MDDDKFIKLCKEKIVDYTNTTMNLNSIDRPFYISTNNVQVVWFDRALQNSKALLSTTINDGLYYEVIYNEDKNELYFDVYKRIRNKVKLK
ncbi:hypothetical protein FYM68_01465 [Lactobacillus salivarius]|uniref:DUF6275 family protein n=1 Tax=Ligilactobacillus salivarius TaxID=1624 RepID=UPI00136B6D39|nr:DUF6275 family protein [Ligilactobacillus salivarius]MYU70420.1 hypothetical protein [Ligilactobacillus salivarius]MYZ74931.1 hypothetical protein [Ligilactobacillus salivarius]